MQLWAGWALFDLRFYFFFVFKLKHVRLLMCQEHCCGAARLCGMPQQSVLTCCPGLPRLAVSRGTGGD